MLMISTINRIHVQGTSCHAVAFGEGGTPHKPIGLELRAERFTPVPGVHNSFERDVGYAAAPPMPLKLSVRLSF